MRISWITFGAPERGRDGALTSALASLRYRVLSPIGAMPKDHRHQIVASLREEAHRLAALDADVIVFSKSFDPVNEELTLQAAARGVPVVFDVCDDHYQHPQHGPHYRRMTELADLVVCSTEQMKRAAMAYAKAPRS